MARSIYRPRDAELSQGDIIDGVPHLRLRPQLEIIRQITVRGGRMMWAPFPYPAQDGNRLTRQRLARQ